MSIGGVGGARDGPDPALLSLEPAAPASKPRKDTARESRDETGSRSGPSRAPSSNRGASLSRPRAAELNARFRMDRLRRMNAMAFGQAAAAALHEQANELIAELEGQRAPTDRSDRDGDEAVKNYILLREALESTLSDPAKAQLRKRIEEAIEELVSEHGQRIVGDLNISGTLEQFSGVIRDRDQMRRLYHDAIVHYGSVAQTYDAMLKAFGPDRLPEAFRSLGHALKEDMLAPMACADPLHLNRLMGELQRANMIMGILASTNALDKVFPSLRKKGVRMDFIGKLLHLVIDGGGAAQIKGIAEWLAAAPQADEPEAADPSNPADVIKQASVMGMRQDAVRKFVATFPVAWWKPNARNAAIAAPGR